MIDPAILLPLAHAGHWLPYVGPVAIVLVAVTISTLRERARRAREGDGEGRESSGDDRDGRAGGPAD